MKTISKRFLKGGLALLLAFVMLFGTTITGFAAVVDKAQTGYDLKCVFIYDNTYTKWSSVQLMIGHNSYSEGHMMTRIANTNLWYYNQSSTWGGATHIAVFNASSQWGGENNSVSHRVGYMDKNSSAKALSGNMTSGTQLLTSPTSATSSTDNFALTTTYLSDYNGYNTTQTAQAQYAAAGSSSYNNGTTGGTTSVSSYKLTSNTASTSTSGSGSASAARSATVTMKATAAAGYNFVGWFTSTSATTATSTSTTYTYTCSGSAKTVYARFQQAGYSYTVTAGEGGTASPASGTATSVDITAEPKDGYKFVSWEATNGSVADTSDPTTTFTITANGANAHATFAPEDYTVTLNANGGTINSGNVTGYTYGDTVTLPTNVTKTGYTFQGWKDDATGSTVTSITSTTYGNKSYTAQWKINTYTITVNQNAGGTTKVGSTTISATTGTATFDYGTQVTVVVTPSTNYKISSISGAISNGESTTAVTKTFTVTGDATINVSFALAGSCSVHFNSNATKQLVIGETYTNAATTDDTYCKGDGSVTYSSNNPTVADVDADGKVTAYKPGTATITATCPTDKSTATYQVTVLEPTLTFDEITLDVNGTADADDYRTVGNTPKSSYSVTYTAITSGDINVTTAGVITAKAPTTGVNVTAKITCGSWSKTVTFPVVVNTPTINFNPKAVSLIVGQTMTDAFVASASVGDPTITITSDDTTVITLADNKGTAKGAGSTTITATFAFNDVYSVEATSNVLVAAPEITANPTSVALEFGEGATATSKTVTLDTNAAAGNGTGDTITVTSANANVATATLDGSTVTITATGVGSTTVTAKFHDATVEIPVTVTKYDPYVYLYVTDSQDWGNMFLHSWKGSNSNVTTLGQSNAQMIYIGRNGDDDKIFAYRFLKGSEPEKVIMVKTNSWPSDNLTRTDDYAVDFSKGYAALYIASTTNNSGRRNTGDWTDDCMIVRPTVSVADVVVPVSGTETATATVTNGGVVYWTMADTATATVADVTTATATVTGVTPGDTTISARAFVDTANSSIKELPTNYKTDSTCWPFISTEATATVTVGSVDYDITASTSYSNNGTDYVDGTNGGTATITVDGEDLGTSAAVAHGNDYTLTATAATGYRFVGWYKDGEQVSTEASYTVNAKAAADYTAKFVKTYKVSVLLGEGIDLIKYNNVPHDANLENITVDAGASIEVYATPSENYAFQNWTDANDDIVSSNPTYTIGSVNADVVLTANAVPTYTATAYNYVNKVLDNNGTYGGTVTINGDPSPVQCLAGETVTFEATPNTNYYFAGWYSDVEFTDKVSDDAVYETTMTEDGITLYGLFVKKFFITNSDNVDIAEFVYDIANNTYSATGDYNKNFTVTSVDGNDVNANDVNVTGGSHTGCTVAGHYTSYLITPDTENYDITAPVTYTLTPDVNDQGAPDGTYTMSIALQAATKVEISVNGEKVADKAIGSTFSYEIAAPAGQYLSDATIEPAVDFEIVDGEIKFTVPDENVNIVPSFANYSYVELFDSTGITATGLKTGYKAGEAVSITLSPASEATTISQVVADYDSAVITQNGDNWTITIASMPADTTITLTPTVDAKFVMNYGTQVAIGNYGTGVTTNFGTVSMSIGDTALANGGYAAPTDTVTYTATETNANYVFAGFYSDAECENVLSYNATYEVKPTKDTTVYTLWARRQYMDFDSGTTNIVKELVYDKQERVYTLSTVLADNSSTNAISKGAWFQVTNDKNDWTGTTSYHHFGSDFSVSHNANGFDATISWNDGGNSWKLSTSAANDTAIKFILTPTGNTAIDFSAQVGEVGSYVYLSSGRLDLPGSYNATVFEATSKFTTEGIENPTDTYVANEGENREKYKRISVSEAQTLTWETEITGTAAANYEVNSFVVYFINNDEKTYEIVTPVALGGNKYSGSVYVDGPCYIVPIYFLTPEYAQANNLAEIDIYFDATAIKDKSWGPFVACYAWGSNSAEYHGGWSGQMMIPTPDGKSFYTMLTVPKAGAEGAPSIPNGVTFNNYTQSTVPGSNPGAFGISATQYQCYDYREPITLYEAGYDVITFVAKDSTDGYHGDRANGVTANTITSTTTNIFDKYEFDYLYSRDGVTPMDFNGDTIEDVSKVEGAENADYYVIAKGDITYDPNGTKYVGDNSFDADWAVDWYIFDNTGKYLAKILSTAMWHDKDNDLENLHTYLHDALGTNKAGVAGKTVAISYEHENNAGHQVSYDGQWYGNFLQDTVKGQVKVGFQNADGTFDIDADETPNEADYGNGYLVDENGEYHQTLDILLDYGVADLHAERKDGYAFVGWFTQLADGSYKKITNAFDFSTNINLDETYYAIFRYLDEGEVVINHLTYVNPNDPAIPSHGGVAEMTVKVVGPDGVEYNGTPSTSRSSASFIGEENVTYTVTITTTPLMNGEFFAWYTDSDNYDGTKTYEEVFTRDDVINSTSTVTATFEYTYTPDSQKVINIYSDVKRVTNTATLVYKYYNRFGELRTYTVKDVPLTDEECLGFVGNGVNKYVPAYITAYTFLYNGEEVVVYGEDRYKEYAGNTDYQFVGSYNKVSAYAPRSEVTEVFDGTVQWIISDTTLTTESSLVTLVADQGAPTYTVNYSMGDKSGYKTDYYNELINITAPTTYNGKEFSYWYEPATGEILTYSVFYNYRIVEDKTIEAVYGQTNLQEWVPSINSIVTTREFADGGDYIYTDHLLAFNNVEGLVLKDVQSAKSIEYGLMVLRQANYSITDDNVNNVQYPDATDATIADRLKTIASVRKKNSAFKVGETQYNCYFYNLSQSQMTNFNRLDYYIKYDNNAIVDTNYHYRDFAYTAVAYIIVDGTVYLSNPKTNNFYELGNEKVTDSTN